MPNETPIISKFPKRVFVFYMLVCILPGILNGPILEFIRELSLMQFLALLTNPIFLSGIALFGVVIPVIYYNITVRKIFSLNSTEESIAFVNKTVKNFETRYMLYGVAVGFVNIALISLGLRMAGIPYDPVAIAFVCIATTFLFALSPYIIFMQQMEHSLSKLQFKTEYK